MEVAFETHTATHAPVQTQEEWSSTLDRVDVYPSKDGYTATVIRCSGSEGESPASVIRNARGSEKRWRDLDNLVAYVLRNVSSQPAFYVHTGARKCTT